MSTELVPARYSFGACEIDLSSRLLSVSGQPRHVERKTLDLLLYLIEHRGRVVTKQELNAALWGGCVVSDGALTQCVWTARRAIDDPRPRGAMIQTHNGVGYRFAGHVTVHRAERTIDYAARESGEYRVIPGGAGEELGTTGFTPRIVFSGQAAVMR